MPAPIRFVVFDLAGTTVNDEGGAVNNCLRAALAKHGVMVSPEAVDAVMGLAKPEAIAMLVGETRLRNVESIHQEFVSLMTHHYSQDPSIREIEGVSALFGSLKAAGLEIAVDTGFSRNIADVLLGRMGWKSRGLIDACVTSDEVPRGRPYPYMIQSLMKKFGVSDPGCVAKVGDAVADLQEGSNAGCGLNIGVTWGSHRREQLTPYPHTHLVDTIAELERLLVEAARQGCFILE